MLEGVIRRDLMQADIAPLAAVLIGIPIPLNSVGVLPLEYLEPGAYRAESVAINAREILAQVELKSSLRGYPCSTCFLRARRTLPGRLTI